jgi:hypothetical protein
MSTFQLVLQFACDSTEDFDTVLELEELLVSILSASDSLDGHDVGASQANIFIHTKDPAKVFKRCQALLEGSSQCVSYKAAYRSLAGSSYTVLHPKGSSEFTVV